MLKSVVVCVYLGPLPQHIVELSLVSEISRTKHYKRCKTVMSNVLDGFGSHKNIAFFFFLPCQVLQVYSVSSTQCYQYTVKNISSDMF